MHTRAPAEFNNRENRFGKEREATAAKPSQISSATTPSSIWNLLHMEPWELYLGTVPLRFPEAWQLARGFGHNHFHQRNRVYFTETHKN